MEVGGKYKFTIPREGKGSIERIFIGQVIQICDRHITFRHKKHGFCESFLKVDLAQFEIKEVSD